MNKTFAGPWILISIPAGLIFSYFIYLLLTHPTAFIYFPGDPAYVDMIMPIVIPLILVTSLVFAGERIKIRPIKLNPFRIAALSLVLGSLIPVTVTYGARFSPLWAEIRDKPPATPEINGKVYDWESDPHPDFLRYWANLPGYGRVIVKKARVNPRYILVDFGHGANAAFVANTMYCDYSD